MGKAGADKAANDNHSNQLNPNNAEFYHSRGMDDEDAEQEAKEATTK